MHFWMIQTMFKNKINGKFQTIFFFFLNPSLNKLTPCMHKEHTMISDQPILMSLISEENLLIQIKPEHL